MCGMCVSVQHVHWCYYKNESHEKVFSYTHWLQEEVESKDTQLLQKDGQLQEKDNQLRQKDRQLQEKDRQLQEKDEQLKQKDGQTQHQHTEIQETATPPSRQQRVRALREKKKIKNKK